VILGALLACAASLASAPAEAYAKQSCNPVVNPYPDSRYEGVDLRRIKASGIGCPKARRVAAGAHKKALRIAPPADGIRRYSWNGWEVVGDIRSDVDRYVAKRRGDRVRWVF
jgi:hypothetical protein